MAVQKMDERQCLFFIIEFVAVNRDCFPPAFHRNRCPLRKHEMSRIGQNIGDAPEKCLCAVQRIAWLVGDKRHFPDALDWRDFVSV